MSETLDRVKCACGDCGCMVETRRGVARDGKIYCCENCASHHVNGAGCHHDGCACAG